MREGDFSSWLLMKKASSVSLLRSDNACNQVVSKYFVYFTGVFWVTAVLQRTFLSTVF